MCYNMLNHVQKDRKVDASSFSDYAKLSLTKLMIDVTIILTNARKTKRCENQKMQQKIKSFIRFRGDYTKVQDL